MSDVVRVDIADGVATVSLNRPDKLNAVSPAVFQGLYEAGRAVEADESVRAVLLRGEGRAFCSGLDLASLQAFGSGNVGNSQTSSDGNVNPNFAQGGFAIWATMDKPVVAAVQGYALGAGFQLALAAEIRGELDAQAKCITSNDMREAVAAAFEKRPGTYTGT
jgi:enoyl-CoA hydratase/carnithine racemase